MTRCRACDTELTHVFADLGRSPLANSYRTHEQLNEPEQTLPLRVFVCEQCKLVQLPECEKPENIFSEYAYFSSCAPSWVGHMGRYAAAMTLKLGLTAQSLVVDIGSNDGYLLQHFKTLGTKIYGVDPARNVAQVALEKAIPTYVGFFDHKMAMQLLEAHGPADLMNATNVLAHVPDIHYFVAGFHHLLAKEGTITFEFPWLVNLIREKQFDTIYHEHYSYLSLLALEPIFRVNKLRVYDVDQIPTHGGSLRLHVCHTGASIKEHMMVQKTREDEHVAGLHNLETYTDFAATVPQVKYNLLKFLIRQKELGKKVVGFGAPAKGVTLLNYCGIGPELLEYTVDATPAKQGKYIPGVQIPIYPEQMLFGDRPDFVLILPWNLKEPIMQKANCIREWGGRFVTAIPKLQITH